MAGVDGVVRVFQFMRDMWIVSDMRIVRIKCGNITSIGRIYQWRLKGETFAFWLCGGCGGCCGGSQEQFESQKHCGAVMLSVLGVVRVLFRCSADG